MIDQPLSLVHVVAASSAKKLVIFVSRVSQTKSTKVGTVFSE